MFKLVLFIHIIGVLGLFAALALELTAVFMLRRAVAVEQVRDAGAIFGKLGAVFGPASVLIWLSGIYLTALRIHDHQTIGWVVVSLILFAVMGARGSSFSKRMSAALKAQLAKSKNGMTDKLKELIESRELPGNAIFGIFAALGIVFLMVFHPNVVASIIVLIIALALGYIVLQRLAVNQSKTVAGTKAK